ncbi:MAG: hypothetical protein V3U84_05425, partial [Thiotrichaceae bacterium]
MRDTKTIQPGYSNVTSTTAADKKSADLEQRPLLIYFVSEDWYFCSHRLQLAKAALNAGFD